MGYHLFTVEPLGPYDFPILITTAYRNAGGYLKGEWFIVFPEHDPKVVAQAVRFRYKDFPAELGLLDESFMEREMMDQATLRLRTYMHEKKIDLGGNQRRWRPEIQEENKSLFIHLWVRGGYDGALQKVFHATLCDELRNDIQAVAYLEGYERQDL
jgi:hypothetical protein